ncbi:MAG: oligoendopeptidase [Oscillospiraceae bacterium]|nr:oligoendopeptidase [Oscillospiraceae bacterium]
MTEHRIDDRWDLSHIYENDQAWEAAFQKLITLSEELPAYCGCLGEPSKLLEYLNLDERIGRLAQRIGQYAGLHSDEDATNMQYMSMKGRAERFFSELGGKQAFFTPEILAMPEEQVLSMLREVPGLEPYRFALESILREKPHTLDKQGEELLAYASDCLSAPQTVSNLLRHADLKFSKIEDANGSEVELNEGNYPAFLMSKDRRVRKDAFESVLGAYETFRNTFAGLLVSSVKTCVFNANMRHYPSALSGVLDHDNIPTEVYHNTIDAVGAGIASLHRYVGLKKRMLGVEELHIYDLYAPVIDIPDEHIEFDEAVTTIKTALQPMGKPYIDRFQEGIDSRWVDRYPRMGKVSGAYSSGSYDTMPYILLNYNYTLEDVLTLAHEMGHSLHTRYTVEQQPFVYSDYALFCAEVASITNEIMVSRYLCDRETDPQKRLHLISLALEQIRTTVFRQTLFAEFELYLHEELEKGMMPMADELCQVWHELNLKYYGDQLIIDPLIDVEWARIPHFYTDFYVYQYVTGYAAASAFAEMLMTGEEGALERYQGFLKSGSSDYPVSILQKAGVDMTQKKPFQQVLARFDALLDALEAELK